MSNTIDKVSLDTDEVDFYREAKTFKNILSEEDLVKSQLPKNVHVINDLGQVTDIPTYISQELSNTHFIDDDAAYGLLDMLIEQDAPQEVIDELHEDFIIDYTMD